MQPLLLWNKTSPEVSFLRWIRAMNGDADRNVDLWTIPNFLILNLCDEYLLDVLKQVVNCSCNTSMMEKMYAVEWSSLCSGASTYLCHFAKESLIYNLHLCMWWRLIREILISDYFEEKGAEGLKFYFLKERFCGISSVWFEEGEKRLIQCSSHWRKEWFYDSFENCLFILVLLVCFRTCCSCYALWNIMFSRLSEFQCRWAGILKSC